MDQVARTLLGLLLLAAVACVVPLVDGVRQARAVLWAAARGAVQLLAVGLLRSSWAEQAGRRRRLYELTAKGVSALAELQGEWRRFSTGVQAVVGGTG